VSAGEPLLSIRGLTVSFATDGGVLRAVDQVSFDVPAGRSVGLVGESGCGKSVTAYSIMRLIPTPPGKIEAGQIVWKGRDLLTLSEREMRAVRGAAIGMVFQEPMTSLNPVYKIGAQVVEAIRLHRDMSRSAARRAAIELLRKVGLPQPEEHVDSYPHELSGGMRQRVMIAMALACDPELVIADEPTSALDMMTQAQIIELLKGLRAERAMSLLLITHDLGVVAELCDEVVVLYAGVVVERGPASAIITSPDHPYTRALLRSVPPTGPKAYRARGQKGRRLPVIEGALPDLRSPPDGCRFQDRCPDVFDRCRKEDVPFFRVEHEGADSLARCFLLDPAAPRRSASETSKSASKSGPTSMPVSAPLSMPATLKSPTKDDGGRRA
jgi:peptide/nickel transport system ATP-binding protein